MSGLRSPSLLVFLMALLIILAFLLAFTLVVTAGPQSDQNDNHPMNLAIRNSATTENASQCTEYDNFSVQETCPKINNENFFGDVD